MSYDQKLKGTIYALLSAVTFAASSTLAKKLQLAGLTTSNLLFWRYIFAFIIAFIIVIYRKSSLNFDKKAIVKTFFSAIIFYSGSTFFYVYSFNHIGTGLASAICGLNTVFVTLYVWCFDKQKIKSVYLLALFLNIVGFFLILKNRQAINIELYGILFALFSGFLYAGYIIVNRDKGIKLDPILSAFMLFFANSIVYSLSSLYHTASIVIPHELNIWLMILTLSVLCTLLPIYFLLAALRYVNASDVSMLGILRPVFAIIFGFIFLNEVMGMLEAIGILLIFAGTIVNQWKKN